MTGEGGDVIVIIWYGCVNFGVCVVVVANSTVKRGGRGPSDEGLYKFLASTS